MSRTTVSRSGTCRARCARPPTVRRRAPGAAAQPGPRPGVRRARDPGRACRRSRPRQAVCSAEQGCRAHQRRGPRAPATRRLATGPPNRSRAPASTPPSAPSARSPPTPSGDAPRPGERRGRRRDPCRPLPDVMCRSSRMPGRARRHGTVCAARLRGEGRTVRIPPLQAPPTWRPPPPHDRRARTEAHPTRRPTALKGPRRPARTRSIPTPEDRRCPPRPPSRAAGEVPRGPARAYNRRPRCGRTRWPSTTRSSASSISAASSTRQPSAKDDLVLYDSRDLATHAVCVGMTGSGKTGLCIALLEEAAIDGMPAICIDPKGDLANLLLTFPDLRAAGLPALGRPGRGAAQGRQRRRVRREDRRDLEEGLAEWGQTPERIARCATPPTSRSTRPAPRPACRCRCCARSRRRRPSCSTTPTRCASASARSSPACWRCSASTPTRCRAASTSCSPTSSTAPGARARRSTSPA